MATTTTYTRARENFAALLAQAVDDREIIIIKRRNRGDVALIAADELAGMSESLHLLRGPKNRKRLLRAVADSRRGKVRRVAPADLRRELGL